MIKNETTVTKPTVNNLISGNVYRAGYKRGDRDFTDANRFVGYKVGELRYSNLALLKQSFGVKNLKELEFETDRLELGSVYCEWFNCDGSYFWCGYLWEGAFRVGSSADRLKLATV